LYVYLEYKELFASDFLSDTSLRDACECEREGISVRR